MIDFHCHLDLYPNSLELLDEVSRRNEFTLAVTTSPRAFLATSRVFAGRLNIHVSLGLHPEVAEAKQNEEALLLQLVASTRFIGEIGLDGSSRFKQSLSIQERIFTAVLTRCERVGGRVTSIHSRGAESRVLDALEAHPNAGIPVLHWFSGSRQELKRAVELGCWFSVGPAMLATEKGRTHFGEMPMNCVLPETDGPFARRRGRPLMPWEAADITSHLVAQHGNTSDQVAQTFRRNLSRLLELSSEYPLLATDE